MSKLERLNARVAKLLTEAVQEVLEVVKETVLEYQEKTARTQRENESLKRRLQELQDNIPRDGTTALHASGQRNAERGGEGNPERERGLPLRPDSGIALREGKDGCILNPDRDFKQESRGQESYDNTETKCDLAQALAEYHEGQPEEATHMEDEAMAVHAPHGANKDAAAAADSPNDACTSVPAASVGVDLAAVKRESEPAECATARQPPLQDSYSGCVDLSCNSSRHSAAGAQRPQAAAEPYGLVLFRSSHSASRRHGFAKPNRAACDGRRIRAEHHLRRDESHACLVCGKTFSRVGNLKIHQRCHTGEKPYGCVQCGRRFTQAGDLKKHKRVHTGEKPYYCNQCGKSFSRGENLKRHQKIHIGETLPLQHA